eukprot:UN02898
MGEDNCVTGKLKTNIPMLISILMLSLIHLELLYSYVKIVMVFINVENEILMILDVEEKRYYDYVLWLTKLHFSSTFMIIITTWARFLLDGVKI